MNKSSFSKLWNSKLGRSTPTWTQLSRNTGNDINPYLWCYNTCILSMFACRNFDLDNRYCINITLRINHCKIMVNIRRLHNFTGINLLVSLNLKTQDPTSTLHFPKFHFKELLASTGTPWHQGRTEDFPQDENVTASRLTGLVGAGQKVSLEARPRWKI